MNYRIFYLLLALLGMHTFHYNALGEHAGRPAAPKTTETGLTGELILSNDDGLEAFVLVTPFGNGYPLRAPKALQKTLSDLAADNKHHIQLVELNGVIEGKGKNRVFRVKEIESQKKDHTGNYVVSFKKWTTKTEMMRMEEALRKLPGTKIELVPPGEVFFGVKSEYSLRHLEKMVEEDDTMKSKIDFIERDPVIYSAQGGIDK